VSATSRALDQDTIAAIATPSGRGGVSVIRVSGPDAKGIAERLTQRALQIRHPALCRFIGDNGHVIDEGLTLLFEGPASFTGEDVAEFHGHGGVVITNLLLEACLSLGARLARPGEFSERAFLNNKLDLAQAEGLADLIDAPTVEAARQASASLQGVFSNAVNEFNQKVIELRVYVEASMDFPEEEIDFLSEGGVFDSLSNLKDEIGELIRKAQRGALMSRGAQIVMTGAPNAGKSSLMNRLANQAVAIVTDIPGTTRDVIRQSISIEGVAIQLSDTAGIRAASNEIEREGIQRAQAELERADIIIEVIDDTASERVDPSRESTRQPFIRVHNKIDLSHRTPGFFMAPDSAEGDSGPVTIAVSAVTGDGIDELERSIIQHLGFGDASATTPFSARERHVTCLKRADGMLQDALLRFKANEAGELLAEDLRDMHTELASITGAMSTDDLLGEIFSSFCIGK
jgi:tRNA modification GTPase